MRTQRSTFAEQVVIAALIVVYCAISFRVDGRIRFLPALGMPFMVLGLLAGLAVHELSHAITATLRLIRTRSKVEPASSPQGLGTESA